MADALRAIAARCQKTLLALFLHCSVQLARRPRRIALHPDVGEGAKPAGSSLPAGFLFGRSASSRNRPCGPVEGTAGMRGLRPWQLRRAGELACRLQWPLQHGVVGIPLPACVHAGRRADYADHPGEGGALAAVALRRAVAMPQAIATSCPGIGSVVDRRRAGIANGPDMFLDMHRASTQP
ncbi:MAG: hypothetical protein J0I22_06730 [Stenotrophomonas nitritireducens]|nr:hypothetical protein [Stenotrophomonas nitritireducens]